MRVVPLVIVTDLRDRSFDFVYVYEPEYKTISVMYVDTLYILMRTGVCESRYVEVEYDAISIKENSSYKFITEDYSITVLEYVLVKKNEELVLMRLNTMYEEEFARRTKNVWLSVVPLNREIFNNTIVDGTHAYNNVQVEVERELNSLRVMIEPLT